MEIPDIALSVRQPWAWAIIYGGKPAAQCPDGPRYKALGNSWAVPKFRWLGERIETQRDSHDLHF